MKRFALLAIRLAFLGACTALLISALRSYSGTSDWKTEEVLAFQMMVLTFPSCIVVYGLIIGLISVLRLFGADGLMLPTRPEMVCVWVLFVVGGYLQWFVFLPRLIELKKKRPSTLPDQHIT